MNEYRPAVAPRISSLKQAGKIRVALFLPQYATDQTTGALRGLGTGYAATQIAPDLARRLGIKVEMLGYPTPASVVAALKAGGCDMAFLGIEPSRVAELDFSPALFEFDYTFLVPAGSSIRRAGELDQPGIVIAIVEGHASSLALRKLFRNASLHGEETPDRAFGLLCTRKAQALACPRDVLLNYAASLPGSRVLDGAYGVNCVGIAIRKGDAEFLALVSAFVADIKASGFLQRVVESDQLLGFRVADNRGETSAPPDGRS